MRSLIVIAGILLFLGVMSFSGDDNAGGYRNGQSAPADVNTLTKAAKGNIKETASALSAGSLTNAVILKTYAEKLAEQKPELKEISRTLGQDATTKGPLFKHLEKRLDDVDDLESDAEKQAELAALAQAADPGAFNDALLDPVNTLAGLSDGKLPLVKLAEGSVPKGAVPASAMVGNPAYGQWQSSPSGGNFWVWYGAYRMIGDVLWGGSPLGYNRWDSRRSWSQYNDYGSRRYGSPASVKAAPDAGRRTSNFGGSAPKKNNAFAPSARRSSSYETTRRPTTRSRTAPPSRTSNRRSSNYSSGFFGGIRGGGSRSRSRGGFSFGGK